MSSVADAIKRSYHGGIMDRQGTTMVFVEYLLARVLEACKNVSTTTASRDLRQMVADQVVEVSGAGRMTRYRKKLERR